MKKASKEKTFKVCAAYDTETTNYHSNDMHIAFPILFIVNDLRFVKLSEYDLDKSDDVRFYRHEEDMLEYIDELIGWGLNNNIVPIICAYNLMFDLQPLLENLAKKYQCKANAQSSTSVYTFDLFQNGDRVLRFWDTFYLEQNGLSAMGKIAGVPKATGDWDYSLIRSPETPISDLEFFYAKRDVQVIPAFLKYTINANEFVRESDLGVRVLTKTSLVRRLGSQVIGKLKYENRKHRKVSLKYAFETTCMQEFPRDYDTYALRKACFRGGLTFTSGTYASQVQHNVASLDVTSMHHAFINGRYVPVHFNKSLPSHIQCVAERIKNMSVNDVLRIYAKPFDSAFHARIEFTNIRLKKNSVYNKAGIAILPSAKFAKTYTTDIDTNERNKQAEEDIKKAGYVDVAYKPVFAFSKLIKADKIIVHVNEIEFYSMCLVYDFDSFRVIFGELTHKFMIPPDYVTLQSNMLFNRKSELKKIINTYVEGESYTDVLSDNIPQSIQKDLRNGVAQISFLNSFYNGSTKGMFNSIYGSQAQDVMKPSFIVDTLGELHIDASTKTTRNNFEKPKKVKVFYNYGMRIVAGSRLHLLIAMQLIDKTFPDARITGGDTDSLKIAFGANDSNEKIMQALQPLHNAITNAINVCMRRIRVLYPQYASNLDDIGCFDIEKSIDGKYRYENHIEYWNKCRISANGSHYHITAAGISRPANLYNIENAMQDMHKSGYSFDNITRLICGYNVTIDYSLSYSLQHSRPLTTRRVHMKITDYQGNSTCVAAHESIALYESAREIGSTLNRDNYMNLQYLKARQIDVDTSEKYITIEDKHLHIYKQTIKGLELIVDVKCNYEEQIL